MIFDVKRNRKILGLLIFLLVCVGIIIHILFKLAKSGESSDYLENLYHSGGILSGIFAGLAFIGVLITIWIQSRNYNDQKKTNEIQRFETTFFNMLDLHQEIINGLSFSYYVTTNQQREKNKNLTAIINHQDRTYVKGREVFKFLYDEYLEPNSKNNNKYMTPDMTKGIALVIINEGIKGYESSDLPSTLDHYFRHLYRIMKFVNDYPNKTLNILEKYKYTSILRGTLSKYELLWLYYNCLSSYGTEKFKQLIEQYGLLKNIRDELLVESADYKNYIENNPQLDNGFPARDYEFFQESERTYGYNGVDKYYVSAFCSHDDVEVEKMKFKKRESGY